MLGHDIVVHQLPIRCLAFVLSTYILVSWVAGNCCWLAAAPKTMSLKSISFCACLRMCVQLKPTRFFYYPSLSTSLSPLCRIQLNRLTAVTQVVIYETLQVNDDCLWSRWVAHNILVHMPIGRLTDYSSLYLDPDSFVIYLQINC